MSNNDAEAMAGLLLFRGIMASMDRGDREIIEQYAKMIRDIIRQYDDRAKVALALVYFEVSTDMMAEEEA